MLAASATLAIAGSQPAGAQVNGSAETRGGNPSVRSNEILVVGRRNQRYRLPPQFRTVPPDRWSSWRGAVNREFGCNGVGLRGCGFQPNPILTVKSDGGTQVGYHGQQQ